MKPGIENSTSQIQKKEKLVSRIIVLISVVIGILLAVIFTGILEIF